jgi:hypothetical protein
LRKLRDELTYSTIGSSQPEVSAETQREGCIFSSASGTFVDIFIAFDEAHTLAEATTTVAKESFFIVLRRVLAVLKRCPLYSFFLSTGKITQFARPRGQDSSTRINRGDLKSPRPYIYLGFDQLMQERKVFDRWKTLDDVTSLECIAHMGRPL